MACYEVCITSLMYLIHRLINSYLCVIKYIANLYIRDQWTKETSTRKRQVALDTGRRCWHIAPKVSLFILQLYKLKSRSTNCINFYQNHKLQHTIQDAVLDILIPESKLTGPRTVSLTGAFSTKITQSDTDIDGMLI